MNIPAKLWIPLVMVLCILPRAWDLSSDPPADLGKSGGYYADEGFWTHNARNKVLFGKWVMDEWNNMYISPFSNWLTYLSFKTFGVGLRQARLVPVFLSVISVLFLALTLRGATGFLCSVLFSFNYLLIHFGRLALLEISLVFLLIFAWFLLSMESLSWKTLMSAGIIMGMAIGTKLTVLYFFPAVFLAVLLVPGNMTRLKSIMFLVLGIILSAITWLLILGSNIGYFIQYMKFYSTQQTTWLSEILANMYSPVIYFRFEKILVTFIVGMAVTAILLGKIRRSGIPRPIMLALFWFVFGILYLDTLTYSPLRYHIPLIPPLLIMISWVITETWKSKLDPGLNIPGIIFISIFLGPVAWKTICNWFPGIYNWKILSVFLIITSVSWIISFAWLGISRLLVKYRTFAKIFVVFICITFLYVNGIQYIKWTESKTKEIYMISKLLGDRLNGSVFTGQWAPVLCLENKHRAVPVWSGFVNWKDPFNKYSITHGLIWKKHWRQFRIWFPRDFAHVKVIDTLWIKNTQVILCKFN